MESALFGRPHVRERRVAPRLSPRPVVRDKSPEEIVANDVSRSLVQHAQVLARDVGASAILVLADVVERNVELRNLMEAVDFRTILITRSRDVPAACSSLLPHTEWITVPDVHMTRMGQVKVGLLVSLAKGLLQRRDRVICLTG